MSTPKKTAFFDFDGTLIAPIFTTPDGETTIGFLGDKYREFMDKSDIHTYDRCRIVIEVLAYAMRLRHAMDWDVKILTTGLSQGERRTKTEFTKQNLNAVFDEVLFVDKASDKPEYILNYAKQHGLNPSDCLLVEDNYLALLRAAELGIRVMSVSHILTEAYEISGTEISRTEISGT